MKARRQTSPQRWVIRRGHRRRHQITALYHSVLACPAREVATDNEARELFQSLRTRNDCPARNRDPARVPPSDDDSSFRKRNRVNRRSVAGSGPEVRGSLSFLQAIDLTAFGTKIFSVSSFPKNRAKGTVKSRNMPQNMKSSLSTAYDGNPSTGIQTASPTMPSRIAKWPVPRQRRICGCFAPRTLQCRPRYPATRFPERRQRIRSGTIVHHLKAQKRKPVI